MEDVKNTLKALEWTSLVRRVDKTSTLPMVAKPTLETAEIYGITSAPVLLHHFWVTQRLVAQSLEDEGAYVVGPQMEIPSDYRGTFEYRSDQKGNTDVVQTYSSVKEIANSMPEKVFVQERLIVYPALGLDCYPPNGEKVKTVILQPKEPLTLIEKTEVVTMTQITRVGFPFAAKNKFKHTLIPCLVVRNEATNEIINLPLSTRGKFSTISHTLTPGREYDLKDIVNEIDLPFNLTTCRNCPQTLLDEHFLRPGMRLRIASIEQHEVILGMTTQEKIVEFASDGADFILPAHLHRTEDKEQEVAYQTALQRFLMECQIKNSPVNVRDYRKSIRNHVSRTVRPTAPTALNPVAAQRTYKIMPQATVQNGISAIALLSGLNSVSNLPRRSSLPSERPMLPLPNVTPSSCQEITPPLPPRNSRATSSLRGRSLRPMSVAVSSVMWDDWPMRPPPPTPNTLSTPPPPVPERPKSRSVSGAMESSSAMFNEPIWGDSSEVNIQRPSEERTSPYQNVTYLSRHESESEIKLPEKVESIPVLSFDELERSSSPEFEIEASNPTPTVPTSTGGDPLNLTSPLDMNATDTFDDDSPLLENNATPSEDTQTNGNNVDESTAVEDTFAESLVSDARQVMTNGGSISSRSSGSEGSEVRPTSPAKDSASTSTSPSLPAFTHLHQNGFRMSQFSVTSDDTSISHHVSFTCNYLPSPDGWAPPSEISGLTVDEMTNSLRYIGMNEDTVEWFRAEKVDGSLLCCIEEDVLAQHFRLSPFQCKKLSMFRKGWRPKLN